MIDKISILVIEDNIQDFLILQEYIKRAEVFEVNIKHTFNIDEAEKCLETIEFDLIFLDLFLPDSYGQETFLKLNAIVKNIPIIVLSGLSDKNMAFEIVQLGAQDYIVKGEFDELLIEKAIIYSIERHNNQKTLAASEERHRLTFQNAGVAIGESNVQLVCEYLEGIRTQGITDILSYLKLDIEGALKIRNLMTLLSINQEALKLFEMKDLPDMNENYPKLYNQKSLPIFEALILALWEKRKHFKVINAYTTRSGREIVILNRVTIYGYEENNCHIIRSGTDITSLVEKEELIKRQKELSEGLSRSTLLLLEEGEKAKKLENSLKLQAETLGTDSVSIAQIISRGEALFLKLYFTISQISPELLAVVNDSLTKTDLRGIGKNVFERLLKRETVYIAENASEGYSNELVKAMKLRGAKSVQIVPIFVRSQLWGIVVYINENKIKTWHDTETVSVQSFSYALGSFLVRDQAENALKELNNELEERIEKRTEELTEAMDELESFSYSVSHDLRAPLRKVGGFSQILDKEYGGQIPERARHLLNNIKDGAKEMSQLIHDLLEFSKLGRQPISFQPVQMKSLVEEVIADTIHTYTDLNLNFKLGEIDDALGERLLIKHVLNNLVWNAVKFSSKNEKINIDISSKVEHDVITYSVTDNGIGIDMNYANKVFNVFQRLHTKEEYEGTGVGLAIVKRIVKKHHGNVMVSGELGKGATFSFSLPYSNIKKVNEDTNQVDLLNQAV